MPPIEGSFDRHSLDARAYIVSTGRIEIPRENIFRMFLHNHNNNKINIIICSIALTNAGNATEWISVCTNIKTPWPKELYLIPKNLRFTKPNDNNKSVLQVLVDWNTKERLKADHAFSYGLPAGGRFIFDRGLITLEPHVTMGLEVVNNSNQALPLGCSVVYREEEIY